MRILSELDAPSMVQVLAETGFRTPGAGSSREEVFRAVRPALEQALREGRDGWAVGSVGPSQAPRQSAPPAAPVMQAASRPGTHSGAARETIASVFRSAEVAVAPLGGAPLEMRGSLQMIAAQGLQHETVAFGFDDIPGRFNLPATLHDVARLHEAAAAAAAIESTRANLVAWASGERVGVREMSEWIPDSVQRLLQGSVSVEAAELLVGSVRNGAIEKHARNLGGSMVGELLASQGVDLTAPTVAQQAERLELRVKVPDLQRGQYFGDVVAIDHRASMVRVSREECVELPHKALGLERRPQLGDQLHLSYKAGALSVNWASRLGRAEPTR
jgi:hypothetical protein